MLLTKVEKILAKIKEEDNPISVFEECLEFAGNSYTPSISEELNEESIKTKRMDKGRNRLSERSNTKYTI